jgi:hypothetical protein
VTQDEGPRANAELAPPRRGLVRQFVRDLADLARWSPVLGLILLAFPLVVGGATGYLLAERTGAIVGTLVAIVLTLGIVSWAESGR